MKKIDLEIFFISGLLLLVGFMIGILTNNVLKNQKEQKAIIEKLKNQTETSPENDVHLFQDKVRHFNKDSKSFEYKPIHKVKIS